MSTVFDARAYSDNSSDALQFQTAKDGLSCMDRGDVM